MDGEEAFWAAAPEDNSALLLLLVDPVVGATFELEGAPSLCSCCSQTPLDGFARDSPADSDLLWGQESGVADGNKGEGRTVVAGDCAVGVTFSEGGDAAWQ